MVFFLKYFVKKGNKNGSNFNINFEMPFTWSYLGSPYNSCSFQAWRPTKICNYSASNRHSLLLVYGLLCGHKQDDFNRTYYTSNLMDSVNGSIRKRVKSKSKCYIIYMPNGTTSILNFKLYRLWNFIILKKPQKTSRASRCLF